MSIKPRIVGIDGLPKEDQTVVVRRHKQVWKEFAFFRVYNGEWSWALSGGNIHPMAGDIWWPIDLEDAS